MTCLMAGAYSPTISSLHSNRMLSWTVMTMTISLGLSTSLWSCTIEKSVISDAHDCTGELIAWRSASIRTPLSLDEMLGRCLTLPKGDDT